MKIVVNSHINSNIARSHLLDSMKEKEEFRDFEIIIVIGGYYDLSDYEITKVENITYIKSYHNSIDFTALITLLDLYKDCTDEYYLYLHDTCKIGDLFYKKLKSIDLTNVSSIRINGPFSMNIGIYSQKIINKNLSSLVNFKNTDEKKLLHFKAECVKYEDYIFKNDKNNKILDNYNGWNYTEPTDYYKTGTMRIVEYYPNLDLYKIKANWKIGNWILSN